MDELDKNVIYEKALLHILAIHERHVPEAKMRKIRDFEEAMLVAREALYTTGVFARTQFIKAEIQQRGEK